MTVQGIGKPKGCKLIRLTAELDGEVIVAISIRGDFFAIPEEGFDRLERRLTGTPIDGLAEVFAKLLEEEDVEVMGISGEGLAEVLRGAMNGSRM